MQTLNILKKRFYIFCFFLLLGGMTSCADTGVRDDTAYLRVSAQFTDPSKGATIRKSGQIEVGRTVDSLTITRMRLLVSGVKLFREKEEIGSGGSVVKNEPLVVDISTASSLLYTIPFPEGNYDRMKVEIHRLSASETAQYKDDPAFSDFATDERYSVIIEGKYLKDNVYQDFVYRSNLTENLEILMVPSVGIAPASTTDLLLQVVFPDLLSYGKGFLEPEDNANRTEIDSSIIHSIRAAKKQF